MQNKFWNTIQYITNGQIILGIVIALVVVFVSFSLGAGFASGIGF